MSNTVDVEANAVILDDNLSVLDTFDALGVETNSLNSRALGSDGQGSLYLLIVNYKRERYVLINSVRIFGLHVVAREGECKRSIHVPVAVFALRCAELNSPLAINNLELSAELSQQQFVGVSLTLNRGHLGYVVALPALPCARNEPVVLRYIERTADEFEHVVVAVDGKRQYSIGIAAERVSQSDVATTQLKSIILAQCNTVAIGSILCSPSTILDDFECAVQVSNGSGEYTIDIYELNCIRQTPVVRATAYQIIRYRSSAVVIQRTCYERDNQCVRVSSVKRELSVLVTEVSTLGLILRDKNSAVSGSIFLTLAVVALYEIVATIQRYTFASYGCTVLWMPFAVLGNLEVTVQVFNLKGKNTFHFNELVLVVVVAPTVRCACEVIVGSVNSHCGHQCHCKSKKLFHDR